MYVCVCVCMCACCVVSRFSFTPVRRWRSMTRRKRFTAWAKYTAKYAHSCSVVWVGRSDGIICTEVDTDIHAYIQTYRYTYVHTHRYTYAYVHTCTIHNKQRNKRRTSYITLFVHSYMHFNTSSLSCPHVPVGVHTCTHPSPYMHAYVHCVGAVDS